MLEGHPFNKIVYTALIVLALLVLVQRRTVTARAMRQSWPLVLFFVYCLASLAWSDFPQVGFRRWNKAIGDCLAVLLVWTDRQPLAAFKRLLAIGAYILIPLSILFIRYYDHLGRYHHRWFGTTYFCGVALEKNGLGAICLIFGLAVVSRLINLFGEESRLPGRSRHMTAQIVILAMVLWLFSIVDSVTSLMCFVSASVLLFATRYRFVARSRSLVHCFTILLILLPASVAFLDFIPGALHLLGRNSTLTERTDIWAAVIRLTPNALLGSGYETFWLGPRLDALVADVTRWWIPNQSHNGYIEIYANLGWVGLAGLLVVLFHAYTKVARAYRNNVTTSLVLAFFVTGVVYNFTEAAFFRGTFPVWLSLLLALAVPQSSAVQRRQRVIPR